MNEDFAIKVKDLTKSYGTELAVKGIDLQIRRGEIFALLGPNGAGNSTTMKMIT